MVKDAANRILLHTCCAICSGYPIVYLRDKGYDVVAYFYNPNIFPFEEYVKRLEAQRILCAYLGVELIEGEYEADEFLHTAKGFENEPERGSRCGKCFAFRLDKTAQKVKELGIKDFTTSIPISPHKDYAEVTHAGMQTAAAYGLNYAAVDFKKQDGFLKTNKIARELGLYRQKHCGCQFSAINNK